MIRRLFYILLIFVSTQINAQTFTYSGYIRNADGSGAVNYPVKLYKRTTPTLTGFTNQQNYNGHSYYRSTSSMTWTAARQACIDMGGHLVTSTTLAENNFLFSLWPNGWIGLTDEQTEGVWKWVTGEPFSWSYWNGGEPNNAGNEDYIQFVGGGKWNDLPNTSLPYVIEFDYINDFTPWVLFKTVYTNSSGYYSINESTNPATEWYIQFDNPNPITVLQTTDMVGVTDIILSKTIKKSIHWIQYDVNGDGAVTISDAYYINYRRRGFVMSWVTSLPSKLYTTSQYTTLTTGVLDQRSTIPGVTSITINTPVSGGSASYYIIAPGYKGQVTY